MEPLLNIEIRDEQPGDIADIRAIHNSAFTKQVEAQIVDDLRDSDALTISLIALLDGKAVGHVALSPMRSMPPLAVNILGLGPIGVLPEVQKRRVGSQLMHAAIDRCRKLGIDAIVLLGHTDYYPRFGFAPAKGLGFLYGGSFDPGDSWMILPLVDEIRDARNAPSQPTALYFHPAFPA